MNVFVVKIEAEGIGKRRYRFEDTDGRAWYRANECLKKFYQAFPEGDASIDVARRYRTPATV